MDISIIIVNYNTISLLINAIDSILVKTESIDYEVIVVDNNSKDNSKTILAEKYGDTVIYLGLSENIGFGRANNEGAKIAKGRNLFLLNPDTILLNNAVKILSDYLDNNPLCGCCGGNLVDINGKPTTSFRRYLYPSLFGESCRLFFCLPEKILYGKNRFYNHTNKPMKVGYITGADLMIRKELFDRLEGFDPDFFMYYEEAELEYRLSKIHFKIVSVPYAHIVHLEGESFSNNYDRIRRSFVSRNIFLKKTQSLIKIVIINKIFTINVVSHLFAWSILRNKKKIDSWNFFYKLINEKIIIQNKG